MRAKRLKKAVVVPSQELYCEFAYPSRPRTPVYDILQMALHMARPLFHTSICVFLAQDEDERFHVRAGVGAERSVFSNLSFTPNVGIASQVAHDNEILLGDYSSWEPEFEKI